MADFWSDMMAEGERNRQKRALEGVDPSNLLDNLSWSLGLRQPPTSLGSGTATHWGNGGNVTPRANMRGTNRTPGLASYSPTRLPPSTWGTADMQGGTTDVGGIGTPGMNQGVGGLALWQHPGTKQTPAVAAINGAVPRFPSAMLPSRSPRMAMMRPDMPLANQMALNDFDANAILSRSQDPATRAIAAKRGGVPTPPKASGEQPRRGFSLLDMMAGRGMGDGLLGMLLGGNKGGQTGPTRSSPVSIPRVPAALSKSPAVAAYQQQGMTPSQAYAAAAAPAHRPTNAAERSQARQDAAEAEYRALNNFSG